MDSPAGTHSSGWPSIKCVAGLKWSRVVPRSPSGPSGPIRTRNFTDSAEKVPLIVPPFSRPFFCLGEGKREKRRGICDKQNHISFPCLNLLCSSGDSGLFLGIPGSLGKVPFSFSGVVGLVCFFGIVLFFLFYFGVI